MKLKALLLFIALAVQTFAASITCTFTAADGTLLEDYANGAEATWTENTGKASGNIQISNANRAHTTTTNDAYYYLDNFTPATYNYDVEATVTFKSVPTSNTNYFGIGARASSTSATSGYLALLLKSSSGWQIQLLRYGSSVFETANISTPSVNGVTTMKLIVREHTILVEWDETIVIEHSVDDSTPDYLTSAIYPTLFMKGVTAHLDDSTGLHVDDFTVTDAPSAANTTGTLSVNNSDLWFNIYDGTGHPKQSAFAEWRFTTNAQIIKITGTTDMEDDKATLNNLGLFVDGVWMAPTLNFLANETRVFTFRLRNDVGDVKTVRVVNSSQVFPTDETYVQGSYIDSIELQDWFNAPTYTVIPPSDKQKILIYGDSITVGDNASPANRWGWTTMLRNRWGERNVMVEAYGSRSLYEDASDNTARQNFAEKIASCNAEVLWIAIGTNDYGADHNWNATDFGTAYGDLLDKIHAEVPGLIIYCQSPIQRTISGADQTVDEGVGSAGSTMAEYRAAIANAVATRTSYCTYIEGANGAIVPFNNTSDGIHPNSTGHRIYAEYVHNVLFGLQVGSTGTTTVGTTGQTIVK